MAAGSGLGRVALITGATSAIGRAAALRFARMGVTVVASGRNADQVSPLLGELAEGGATATFVPADATNVADVERLVEQIVGEYGRLDYAFNNVGGTMGRSRPIAEAEPEDWNEVVGANLLGLWLLLRSELLAMRTSGGGAIVNTVGVLGQAGAPGMGVYAASKHGAVGLTRTAALEEATAGIRVNGVAPGMTERRETAGEATHRSEQARRRVPLSRLASADEIAAAVVWLCSEEASFVTGQVIVVDGGWSVALS